MSDYLTSRLGRIGAIAVFTLVAAVVIPAAPAFAAAGEACPNEAVRAESNVNPTTGQPYSLGLPECRAYEMVSPLDKQAHDAKVVTGAGLPVAPDGETVGFESEGAFSQPENFRGNFKPANMYLSRRGASGWMTSSAFAPARLVYKPFLEDGLDSDFSPDLRTVHVSCGGGGQSKGEYEPTPGIVCALRKPDGSWVATPIYTDTNGVADTGTEAYLGGSSDLSRVFIQPGGQLLPSDTATEGSTGIYEIAGVGTASPELRLVNVDNNGNELLNVKGGPLIGGTRSSPKIVGTAYHAISQSGRTVFFEATPPSTGVLTLYARVDNGESGAHTVDISNPAAEGASECTTCSTTPYAAKFQGASADGSKVFFSTAQQLLNSDTDTTTDLYEYDFNNPPGKNLVQISGGGLGDPSPGTGAAVQEGAELQGAPPNSSDGSHVYFVAEGVLTTVPNGNGEVAQAGQRNLYGYDTVTGETKFVGVGGVDTTNTATSVNTYVQTTPDGRYLVFSSSARLAGDTNIGQGVYRYDFQTGALTWVSHAAPGFTALNEGKSALVAPLPVARMGANADIDDWSRAISENGEYIIFTTGEKLQANDVNAAADVYLWHNGTVSLISDGQSPQGVYNGEGEHERESPVTAMSSSGADIFFSTHTQLVGQDTDVLRDIYDARTAGGFPKPTEPSCSGEACQGASSGPPSFGASGSSSFTGGGNLTAGPIVFTAPKESKPKPLTRAQKLTKALKSCKKDKSKSKRLACEKQARKQYAPIKKARPKAKH
jgi:hypothetical protein